MTNIDDIRAAFSEFDDARGEHWRKLGTLAFSIADSFSEYIGVKGVTFDLNGQDHRYVDVGYMVGQEFELARSPEADFPIENLALCFCVRVAVDRGEGSFRKERIVLSFTAERKDAGYNVKFKLHGEDKEFYLESGNPIHSQELSEAMAREIVDFYDSSIFSV